MIEILGLTPIAYGLGFTAFAAVGSLGSYLSRYLHNTFSTPFILKKRLNCHLWGRFFLRSGRFFGILFFFEPPILDCFDFCLHADRVLWPWSYYC